MVAFERATFLGLTVRGANASIGKGGQVSTLTVSAVEDPTNGDSFTNPYPGTPVSFRFGDFRFDGLYQNFENKAGQDGNTVFEFTVIDPRQILEGTQIILNGYTGESSSVPNLLNVYGYLENQQFGGSQVNEAGIPWYLVKNTVATLISGNPLSYGSYAYYVDLSQLPSVPNAYRVPGNSIDLLSFIQDICEIGGCEFFVELLDNIICIRTIDISYQPTLGVINQYVNDLNDGSSSNSIGQTLEHHVTAKFLVGGQKEGVYFQFNNGTYLARDAEDDEETPENDYSETDYTTYSIWPFWGFHADGTLIIGEGRDDAHKFILDGRSITYPAVDFSGGYPSDVGELRCAMISEESWETYLLMNDNVPNSPHYGKMTKIKGKTNLRSDLKEFLNGLPPEKIALLNAKDYCNINPDDPQNVLDIRYVYQRRVYDFIRNYAYEYFGRKFMVRIPYVFVAIEPETQVIRTSLEPCESGYLDEQSIVSAVANNLLPLDLNAITDEQNKITCFVKFDGIQAQTVDLSALSETDYVLSGNSVFVRAELDPGIVFQNRGTGAGPRVIITLPAPVFSTTTTINAAGYLKTFFENDLRERGYSTEYITNWITSNFTRVGAELLFFGEYGLPLIPIMVAAPLRNTTKTYGPWTSSGAVGKVEFEQNESLVPWNFDGYTNLNAAANAIVNTVIQRSLSETGNVEIPEAPGTNLGGALVAGGPYVSDINFSIGEGGVTTRYHMNTWTVKPNRLATYNVERLQRFARIMQQQKRLARSVYSEKKPLVAKNISLVNTRFPNRFTPHSSSHVLMADFVTEEGSKKYQFNVAASPLYNISNALNTVNASGLRSNLAVMSMDGMFAPFSTDPRAVGIPHFGNGASGIINGNDINPYCSGHNVGIISPATSGRYINTFNLSGSGEYPEHVKGIGLRFPAIGVGWGYDVFGKLAPSGSPITPKGSALADVLNRQDDWKAAPIDMRYNELQNKWVSGPCLPFMSGLVNKTYIGDNGITIRYSGTVMTQIGEIYATAPALLSFASSGDRCVVYPNYDGTWYMQPGGLKRFVNTAEEILPNKSGIVWDTQGTNFRAWLTWMHDNSGVPINNQAAIEYLPLSGIYRWMFTGAEC